MRCFDTPPGGFLAIFFVIAVSVSAEERKPKGECNFDVYRPLRFGTPIRGGHENLAVEKVVPIYPPEALQKGIRGRVVIHVLINRAGDVVKACGVGQRLLVDSAEKAVSKWKFQPDFGFTFAGKSTNKPQYAVLNLLFDFEPEDTQSLRHTTPPADHWECAEKYPQASDERGTPIWLSSESLMRRLIEKSDLSFPMLGHGHLHGDVKLELLIDERGNVACVRAVGGHPIAISSAMAAVSTWKFRPFTKHDKRMPVLGHLFVPYDVDR
jgi:TonB family protein